MLKISIMTAHNPGSWQTLRDLGFESIDYNGIIGYEPGEGVFALSDEAFEKKLLDDRAGIEAAGLEIFQIHGVWPYDDTNPEQKEAKWQAMLRSIRAAAIMGSEYVVVHPVMPRGWEKSPDHEADVRENIEYMKKLMPYAEKYGVKVALENMPNPYVPCGPVEELVQCIDAVNNPHLVACLDVGHSSAVGCDAGDAVRMLGKRLHCLHIHDNDGQHDRHWLPYYGVTNWKNFTDALKEIGYQGTINLETTILEHFHDMPEELALGGYRWIVQILRHMAAEVSC